MTSKTLINVEKPVNVPGIGKKWHQFGISKVSVIF